MKIIKLEDNKYELVKNYKDGFDQTVLESLYTDYFYDYDYILGDFAYGKLRLKGFCEKGNPKFNSINDYSKVDNYIKENCAYDCKYFIVKKVIE